MDPVAVLLHQLPGLLPTAPWHWKGLGIIGKAEPWKPAMGHRVTMVQTVRKHLFFFFSYLLNHPGKRFRLHCVKLCTQ